MSTQLKVKVLPRFPSSVSVQSPLLLSTTGGNYSFSFDISAIETTLGGIYQPIDQTLTGLSALSSANGLVVETATDVFTQRTLTGTANELTVTNGDGVSGNPTLSIPTAVTFTGKTVTGGTFTGATFTSSTYNKVTITAPATSATLTLIDGTTVTGPAASGTIMTLGNVETITGAKTFNDAKLLLAGSSSGTTTLKSGAAAGSSVITLPVATDTLTGKATTDILTNKTIDTAGTGNHIQISGVDITRGQILGEASTASATAGNIGEYVESIITVGSAVSVSTATAKTVTSISLTAGDWDVSAILGYVPAASTNITILSASLSATTNTQDTTAGKFNQQVFAAFVPGSSQIHVPIPPYRLSLSGTTSVFLVAQATFTVSTNAAFGIIRARRVR